MYRSFLMLIFGMVILIFGITRVLADEDIVTPTIEIHVQGQAWGASSEDIDKVLHSAADQLIPYFHDRKLKPILVRHGLVVPITLDQKGPNGEFQVRLTSNSTFWAQYTYQFAHELCHVLAMTDHQRGRHQWFEESLCETSSLFVLSKMRHEWETKPPYPNWKTWGEHFDEYLNQMLAERQRRLPPDQTMPQWLAAHLDELATEQQVTVHSKLAAAYLLEIFQDQPAGWESINRLNTGAKDEQLGFEGHLQAWRERVPDKHKPFVGKIQKLFGYRGH